MHDPVLRHARAASPQRRLPPVFAVLEAIMYSQVHDPGCPSGQRERTVNLSRKLRWFKSNTWNKQRP